MSATTDTPPPWVASDHAELAARARGWLESQPLRVLVARLAGSAALTWSPADLADWSARVLDTRGGAERREARQANWDEDWVDALLAAAGPLGLLQTARPVLERYDLAILLGGATTGNRMRVALTQQLQATGVRLDRIVALSAERPLSPREHDTDPDSRADGTEWRNLLGHLTSSFGALTPISLQSGQDGHLAWRDEHYMTAAREPIRLLVAPSGDPARRANTADAMTFLAQCEPALASQSALVITSAIYAPYQFFAAVGQLLDAGLGHVELTGTPTSTGGAPLLLAQRLGQEIHAAITAASALTDPSG